MNTYTKKELAEILIKHSLFIETDGAEGVRADFNNANLTNVNFSNAILRYADFSKADLTDTNFTNAYLYGANFTNAILTNAILTNANLGGVTISPKQQEDLVNALDVKYSS